MALYSPLRPMTVGFISLPQYCTEIGRELQYPSPCLSSPLSNLCLACRHGGALGCNRRLATLFASKQHRLPGRSCNVGDLRMHACMHAFGIWFCLTSALSSLYLSRLLDFTHLFVGSPQVWAASFSADGKLISVGSGDGHVDFFDPVSGSLLLSFQAHRDYVTATSKPYFPERCEYL